MIQHGKTRSKCQMANLNNEFHIFHDHIALTAYRKAALRISRDVVRECIRRYFRDTLKVQAPKFRSQGAYAADICVRSIEGEFHVEDGVYLQHLDMQDWSNWPAGTAVQQLLSNAVDSHPLQASMDESGCLRVRYGGRYCVDLSCYAMLDGQTMQAVKGGTGWSASNPIAFTTWFKSYVNLHGEQFRRVIRYLSAWTDYQSTRRGKMPNGSILTVLAAFNFKSDARDDLSLARTLESISNYIRSIVYILNPVNINEELSARLSEAQKTRFRDVVEEAANNAIAAIIIENPHYVSRLWRKLFGDRFPLSDPPVMNGRHQ